MKTIINSMFPRSVLAAGLLAGVAALTPVSASAQQADASEAVDIGIAAFASEDVPPSFDSPAAAVEAFKAALEADDLGALAALLGLDAEAIKADEGTMKNYAQIKEIGAELIVTEELDDRALIDLGNKLWPLPFPIVKGEDGKWSFDTYAGFEEIINRRVGFNELEALATMRAYVDAQYDYASEDRDGDGVAEFAQKLISSEGTMDGLYWPADLGAGESPAGPYLDEAAIGENGYFGYRYRILAGQGDHIAGGAYDYVINDNLIAGFALLAWPVRYGESGVSSFLVSHHGVVYEADLGPATETIVKYIDRFNPDDSWSVARD